MTKISNTPKSVWLSIIAGILVMGALLLMLKLSDQNNMTISSFTDCETAGYPVMESYPRQCSDGTTTFVEEIDQTSSTELVSDGGVELEVTAPLAGSVITSPLTITGRVPGSWSFEANFTIELYNSANIKLVEHFATLEGDWMTTELVDFSAELSFAAQPAGSSGTLRLVKANPSGLVENDDFVDIDVKF